MEGVLQIERDGSVSIRRSTGVGEPGCAALCYNLPYTIANGVLLFLCDSKPGASQADDVRVVLSRTRCTKSCV